MNAKTLTTLLIAVIAATAATVTSASEITPEPAAFISTASRAEVRTQAAHALALGQIQYGEASLATDAVRMGKTRAQVQAETIEAIRMGLVQHGEYTPERPALGLTRTAAAGSQAVALAAR